MTEARLWRLVAWELALSGWGRFGARRAVAFWIAVAAFTAIMWRCAVEPYPLSDIAERLHRAVFIGLFCTPLNLSSAAYGENCFTFIFLRLCAYAIIFAARLTVPAASAGTIVRDVRIGRLRDLILAPFSATVIFAGKVLASVLPFWLTGSAIFAAMAPVAFMEHVTAIPLLRVYLEMSGALLFTGVVTIAASSMTRHVASSTFLAYLFLWAVVPYLWLFTVDWQSRDSNLDQHSELGWYSTIVLDQAVGTVTLIVLMFTVGVVMLRRKLRRMEG